jgi:hypothetical protein
LNDIGLTAHLLPSSGIVCFCPNPPSAAAFPTLEQQHRQTGAADDGCRIDIGERRLERRQGSKRTSCWRGGNLAPGPFVFAIVVGVIAVAIMIVVVTHGYLLSGRL